jgi:hypothetical protein
MMRAYRILLFDRDGKVRETRSLQCDGDDEALEKAAWTRHRHALELWEGERQVWRFESTSGG